MSAQDVVRKQCPDLCVEDHSDYDEKALELGDLIIHMGAEEMGRVAEKGSFTVAFDGADAQPFSVRRFLQQRPNGTVAEDGDGYMVADRFMSREHLREMLEQLYEQLYASR